MTENVKNQFNKYLLPVIFLYIFSSGSNFLQCVLIYFRAQVWSDKYPDEIYFSGLRSPVKHFLLHKLYVKCDTNKVWLRRSPVVPINTQKSRLGNKD